MSGLALTLWVLTTHFRELPIELYRAAKIDGCTSFGAFRRVLLPLAAPGLVTTALLVFIFSWNEFLYALTFTSAPEHRTVPVAIALFSSGHSEPWAQIAAASVVVTLRVYLVEPMGADAWVTVELASTRVIARCEGSVQLRPGDPVGLHFEPQHLRWFDAASGLSRS